MSQTNASLLTNRQHCGLGTTSFCQLCNSRSLSNPVIKLQHEEAANVIGKNSCNFLTEDQITELKFFIVLMLQLRKNSSFVLTTLQNLQIILLELETPEISLRSLEDVIEYSNRENEDVLGWFRDNQYKFIINLIEQLWSWKTINIVHCNRNSANCIVSHFIGSYSGTGDIFVQWTSVRLCQT